MKTSSTPDGDAMETPPGSGGIPSVAIAAAGILLLILIIPLWLKLNDMKTARIIAKTHADFRAVAIAVEAYYVDNMEYPPRTTDSSRQAQGGKLPKDQPVASRFRLQERDLWTVTTPIAYLARVPEDQFSDRPGFEILYYSNSRGYILGSFGPDRDQRTGGDLQWHIQSPTWLDAKDTGTTPAGIAFYYDTRIAQPSELLKTGSSGAPGTGAFTYDPTNGLYSEGDLYRVKQ